MGPRDNVQLGAGRVRAFTVVLPCLVTLAVLSRVRTLLRTDLKRSVVGALT